MSRILLRFSLCGLFLSALVRAGHTEALDSWHWRNPAPSANNLSGVAYGNGLFVAVGGSESVQVSSDTVQWAPEHTGKVGLQAVAFGNGKFVAVGDNGLVSTSADGVHWSSAFPAANSLVGVAFGNGVFVAISSDGVPWVSTNAITWTNGAPLAPNMEGIAFGNGRFAAIGANGIYTATNLTNWAMTYQGAALQAVTYGASGFVAVGAGGAVLTSGTGQTWTFRNSGISEPLTAVAYGNGTFVAASASGVILMSATGANWTLVGLPDNNGAITSMTFGNGLFVAVGNYGLVCSSSNPSDLSTWVNRTSLTTQSLAGVAYGNGIFVAVGQGGGILRSQGGSTWTLENSGGATSFSGITFGAGHFVAIGFPAAILVSADGVVWATNSLATNVSLISITYGAGLFVILASGSDPPTLQPLPLALTSPDAVSWTTHKLVVPYPLAAVAYGAGMFLAVGESTHTIPTSTFVTSTDGATWTCRDMGTNVFLDAITFGNGLFSAFGFDGTLAVSPDAQHWQLAQEPALGGAAAAAYQGAFVAAGFNGIVSSETGLGWTNRFDASGIPLHGIVAGNGTFIAVGDNGAIIQSDPLPPGGSGPPIISEQPQSRDVGVGATVGFGVGASGASLLSYQWVKDGAAITHATNSTLFFINVSASDAAVYWVVVTNAAGHAASQPAVLTVSQINPLDAWHAGEIVANTANGGLAPAGAVAYGNGLFVAVFEGGSTMTSTNGLTWLQHPPSAPFDGQAIAFGNGQFVSFVCGTPLVSSNGVTWTHKLGLAAGGGCLDPIRSIAFGGGKFVAVANSFVAVSTNGLDLSVPVSFLDGLTSIAYGNGAFVAIGSSAGGTANFILTSPDGVGWTYTDDGLDPVFGPGGSFHNVAFGNGQFVVTGLNGYVLVSSDGMTWDSQALPSGTTLDAISYGGGVFVASVDMSSGPPFAFFSSPDGISWTSHDVELQPPFTGTIQSLAFGQNSFVALDAGGFFLQSDPFSPTAPYIVQQPRGHAVPESMAGMSPPTSLNVLASGSTTLSYQWYKDGALLCGSNGPALGFDDPILADTGSYWVVIANSYGSETSAVARLVVEPAQPILTLGFDSAARLAILGCTGCYYRIESLDDFSASSWRARATFALPASPFTWTDLESPFFPHRFYRVVRADTP